MHVDQLKFATTPRRILLQRGLLFAAACVMAATLFGSASSPALAQRRMAGRRLPKQDAPGSFVTGQAIVALKTGATEADMKASLAAVGVEVVRPLARKPYYLVQISPVNNVAPTDAVTLTKVGELKKLASLRSAHPNYRYFLLDTTPNDPRYKDQWNYPLINLPKAWDIARGTNDVVIADTDTGADVGHPDFAGRNITTMNFTVTPPSADVTDTDGHGTHTLGTSTADTNNAVGVAGTSFGINPIFVGKIFGDNGTTSDIIVNCLTYIADNVKTPSNNVIINCSWGGARSSDDPDPNDPVENSVLYAASKNCVLSLAAGNDYDGGNPGFSPARLAQLDPRILCVAACGPQKEHSFFSEARPYTTVSAPGGDDPSFSDASREVLSTLPTNQGGYGTEQGTSMAAPHVTGLGAVLLGLGVPPDQVKAVLTQTADTGGLTVPNPEFGYGVIDAYGAVVLAKSAISILTPKDGTYVYGNVPIVMKAGDPSKYLKAELQVDGDATIVDSANKDDYTLNWDTRKTDPATGAAIWPNGAHKITITVTTPSGPVKFIRSVRVDNPIADISTPAASAYLTGVVSVVGTADGLRLPTYSLEYSLPASPSTWVSILANQSGKVTAGALADWDLKGLSDGGATLRLRVKNPDGYEVAATRSATIDQTPPSIPTNLTGTPSHQTVTLNWGASSDPAPGQFKGYNVYRSRQSLTGYQKVNTSVLPTANYVDTGLTNAFTYFYKIAAVDAAGNESAPTDIKDVTPNRNGTFSGQVIALDGTFLGGADVSVLQNNTPVTNGTMKTDTAGQFAFPGPPGFNKGTYDLKASKPGYVPQLITGIGVDIGRDAAAQNFALQPQPTFPSGWTMFTLPYDFAGQSLSTVFSGGQIKYYDATLGRYLDPTDPAFPKPAPGVGFWLNKSGSPAVTGAGIPNKTIVPAVIPIRKGWNLLGNPFQDPIHWVLTDLVVNRADNGQKSTLSLAVNLGWALDFAWSGVDGKTLIFDRGVIPGVIDTIPGYGAFWFRSEVDGTLSIAPPSIVNRSAKESRGQWTLQLNARAADQTSTAYVGIGGSHRVVPMPPQVTSGVRLLLGENASYAADLRNNTGSTQTWDLTVDNADSKTVTLTWPGSSLVPRGWNLALVDKATGQRVSLRTTSSFVLPANRAARKLQLELVRESSVGRIMITDLAVNASRGTAPAITFSLANDGRTTVSILRSNGDTVRTLASRSVKSGQNSLIWDTKDDQGRSVSPGVYLVQVRAVGDKGDQAKAIVPVVITR